MVVKSTIGTMAYYREVEAHNTKLRGKLLARTKKNKNETAKQWLQRVSRMYERRKIKAR